MASCPDGVDASLETMNGWALKREKQSQPPSKKRSSSLNAGIGWLRTFSLHNNEGLVIPIPQVAFVIP